MGIHRKSIGKPQNQRNLKEARGKLDEQKQHKFHEIHIGNKRNYRNPDETIETHKENHWSA